MERTIQPEIEATWDTPTTRLAAVEALSAEHANIFRPFFEAPTSPSGLRRARLKTSSVAGPGAEVFTALVKSWRGAIRQRYGLSADVALFDLPDPALRMTADKITQLPHLPRGTFSHVKTLRLGWLDAPIEQVRGFTQAFGGAHTIDISETGLTELPIFPSAHPELTRLNLHNNNIVVTPAVQLQFNDLANLEQLNLSNNPLNHLDVSEMTRLTTLNLRATRLASWPTGAENLPSLSWLDLRDNELSSLPQAALSHDDVLMKTQLTGNAFSVQGEASLTAARQRIEITKGLPEGVLQRFDLEPVPSHLPPTETGGSIARHLLPLPEKRADVQGWKGFVRRLQGLNPAMTQEQAVERILQLRLDAMSDFDIDAQINAWYQTYESLTRQLNGWLYTREVRTARTLVSSETRSMAALRIRELWQDGLIDRTGLADQTLNLNGLQLGDLPELAVQLPHVTTLDLSGVGLTAAGSNGFLTAFPQVETLILSSNQLTELPSAVQYMSRLERLEFAANALSDPIPLYQQLGGEQLRWLDLSHNDLDSFSANVFRRIETLNLSHNGIVLWPGGTLAAPQLRTLDLSGNALTDFPAALLDGNHTGLLAGTDLSDNSSLSLRSLEQLRDHSDANGQSSVGGISRAELDRQIEQRLNENDTDSDNSDNSGNDDDDDDDDDDDNDDYDSGADGQAAVAPVEPLHNPALDIMPEALDPWLANTAPELATARRARWNQLAAEPNHERFFQLIRLLRNTDEFSYARADLTRRLWYVMEAATENTELRDLLFLNAETHGTCIDGRILTFSELEVRVFVYHALRNIEPGRPMLRGRALVDLSRQLFRLDRVDVLAEAAALNRDRAEVRLRYRIGLASGWPDGLDLPGQPLHMAFDTPIRGRLLADTRASILEAERSDALLDSMVTCDYWTTFLRERYPDDIRTIEDAVADERVERLSDLEDRRERGEVSGEDYDREIVELGKRAEKLRKQKLIDLTRRAMDELQTLAGPGEQAGTLSPKPGPSHRT
jgi:Leucine-rich repeat (LRR) protein